MKLELAQWEVMFALTNYIKEEYGMECDLTDGIDEASIQYQKQIVPPKKYKNGRPIKNEHGYPVLDYKNATYEDRIISWGETDSIAVYLTSIP